MNKTRLQVLNTKIYHLVVIIYVAERSASTATSQLPHFVIVRIFPLLIKKSSNFGVLPFFWKQMGHLEDLEVSAAPVKIGK